MGVIKKLYTSKPLILTIVALSVLGLFFYPLLALPKMLMFAMLTFTVLAVGARLAKSGAKSAWSSLNVSVSKQEETNCKQGKLDQAVNSMGNGKDLADPMIKALVDKLRDNGLTVTTNWDVAKQVIDALPEKYRHLSENRDNVRGFVYKGKVFINPEKTDLSVPIHEYTHIWAEALRQNNMDEWQNIVSLLKKETQLWADTKKNYPYLETDDEIADEVLAQYSGSYGADKLKAFIVEGDKPKTVFKNLFKALEEFWKHIAKIFDCHFKKTDEIADRVLYDLVRGYNPQKNTDPHVATLSDNKPLSSTKEEKNESVVTAMVDPDKQSVTKSNDNHKVMSKEQYKEMITGEQAEKVLKEILDSLQDESCAVYYPAHIGAVGYYANTANNGEKVFTAFDNRHGDCYVEDFHDEEICKMWIDDILSTKEAHRKDDVKHAYSEASINRKNESLENLVKMMKPFEKGKESIFFPFTSTILRSDVSMNALSLLEPKMQHDRAVESMGILYDPEYKNHEVLFEHSHLMENGYDYHTILGRQLKDLSGVELHRLENGLKEAISHQKKMFPATIIEYYDEDEDMNLFDVTFDKPFDEIQEGLADRYGVETINKDTNTYTFNEYDDVFMFASKNAQQLRMRGQVSWQVNSLGEIEHIVMSETANHHLEDLAAIYGGYVDYTREGMGTPVTTAYFKHEFEVRDYHYALTHLEQMAVDAVVAKTVDASSPSVSAEQYALIQAYIHQDGNDKKKVAGHIDRLFELASDRPEFKDASKLWRDATREEVENFAGNDIGMVKDYERDNSLKR